MWGSWFGMTIGGLLVLLLVVALAFGLSITVFAVFAAILIVGAIGVGYGLKAATAGRPIDKSLQPDPVKDAAPASSEGTPAQMDPRV
jgi:predicted lipid-binding transport protein (Tim44 family)